jgi:hypothetical protein
VMDDLEEGITPEGKQLTVGADVDQSSHMGTDTAPVLLLQDVGFVPGELVDNVGVGHGVAFEEYEHALVVLDWLSDALSVDDCVGIVDVGGVEVRMLFVVDSEPVGDVLVSFEAPEVLVRFKDLLNGVGVRHDAVVGSCRCVLLDGAVLMTCGGS